MKEQVIAALSRVDITKVRRTVTTARLAGAVAMLALAADPAMAQSLKQAGVNIFNVIYGVVGVIGAIACLLTLLNWVTGNWLGRDDPKKIFFQALIGTALAFGVVAIIQFVKDMVGGSASGISNL
jgi:Kef-type K+ transport system membrane component KefB